MRRAGRGRAAGRGLWLRHRGRAGRHRRRERQGPAGRGDKAPHECPTRPRGRRILRPGPSVHRGPVGEGAAGRRRTPRRRAGGVERAGHLQPGGPGARRRRPVGGLPGRGQGRYRGAVGLPRAQRRTASGPRRPEGGRGRRRDQARGAALDDTGARRPLPRAHARALQELSPDGGRRRGGPAAHLPLHRGRRGAGRRRLRRDLAVEGRRRRAGECGRPGPVVPGLCPPGRCDRDVR